MKMIKIGLFLALMALTLGSSTRTGERAEPAAKAAATISGGVPLRVVHLSPVDSVEGQRETVAILVGFNQPMTALQAVPREDVQGPLEIRPALKGKYRWMGTKTLAFVPADTLPPETEFTITLKADRIKSLTGARLERDTSWSFTTWGVSLVSSVPYQSQSFVNTKAYVFLLFNRVMPADRVQGRIRITATHGMPSETYCGGRDDELVRHAPQDQEEIPFKVRHLTKEELESPEIRYSDWDPDKAWALVPQRPFPIESEIAVRFPPGLVTRGEIRGPEEAPERRLTFRTYNRFTLRNHPATLPCGRDLPLCFANPVSLQEIVKNLTITPPVAIPPDYQSESWASNGHTLRLPFRPKTTYAIRLGKALKDRFGNALGTDLAFPLEVTDYSPTVSFPGPVVPVESKPFPKLPVHFVNVDTLSVEVGYVSLDRAIPFLQQEGLFDRYKPYSAKGFFTELTQWPVLGLSRFLNQKRTIPVVVSDLLSERKGGLIFVQSENLARYWDNEEHYLKSFLEVSDLAVTWKYSRENTVAWVTSLSTAEPVEGVRVELRDNHNRVLARGLTDQSGFCELPGLAALRLTQGRRWWEGESEYAMYRYGWEVDPKLWLTVSKAGEGAVYCSRWYGSNSPYYYGYYGESGSGDFEASLFTEKGLYKAGETVHLKGILRQKRKGAWILPEGAKAVTYSVTNPKGQEVDSGALKVSPMGSFVVEVRLSPEAATGTYNVRVALPRERTWGSFLRRVAQGAGHWLSMRLRPNSTASLPGNRLAVQQNEPEQQRAAPARGWSGFHVPAPQPESPLAVFYQSFQVEAYRPAEFEVKAAADRDTFLCGETFKGKVAGRYLFGMPMPGAPVRWNLRTWPSPVSYPEHRDYVFGGGYRGERQQDSVSAGSGKLSDAGEFPVQAKLTQENVLFPSRIQLEGTVTAPNAVSLSGRESWVAFPAGVLPGLKASRYLYLGGDSVKLSLIVVRTSGEKVSGQAVDVKVEKEEWKPKAKSPSLGGYYSDWEMVPREVYRTQAESNMDSVLVSFLTGEPGYFTVTASLQDGQGRKAKSQTGFYVAGQGDAGWAMRERESVELVADKGEYHVGDTARILVKSPFSSAQALVTLERELVLRKTVRTLRGSADYFEVPILAGDEPNVYVHVTLVRGRVPGVPWDPAEDLDPGRPRSAAGSINLNVEAREKRLKVGVWSERDTYRARDSVRVRFEVKDASGRPAGNSEVTLFAVDVGVLSLVAFQTPDPFGDFYRPRSIAVRTFQSRADSIQIGYDYYERDDLELVPAEGGVADMKAAPRAEAAREVASSTVSRAPGAPGARPEKEFRKEFMATAFYRGELTTDASGRGKADFVLPDNLTKYRIMAVAQTRKSEFGSADSSFTVNQPLLLTPSIPRFSRVGDRFLAGVVVHNRTEMAGKVELQCVAEGLVLSGESRREIELAPNASQEVLFALSAEKAGQAILAFQARMGSEEDALKWTLPVENPPLTEAVATVSSTPDSALEGLIVPGAIFPHTGGLEILLASSVMAGMQRGIEHLLDYPYGCLEQRLSRVLPLIVGEGLINRYRLAPVTGRDLRDTVQAVLDEVPDYQLGDGGFTYFKDGWISSPYLSAYTMYVLKRAEKAGYKLKPGSVAKGKDYLREVLTEMETDWSYPYNQNEKLTTQAFCLYALSLWGVKEPERARELFKLRDQVPLFGKVLLLKSARNLALGKRFEDDLVGVITNKVKLSPTSAHFEESEDRGWTFPSPAKVTAYAIQSFIELDVPFPYQDQAMRWLVQERGKKSLPTTHENAFVFDALQTYCRKYEQAEPSFVARAFLGQKEILETAFQGRTNKPPRRFAFGLDDLPRDTLLPLRFLKQGPGQLYYTVRMTYAYRENPVAMDEGITLWKEFLTEDGKKAEGFERGKTYRVVLHVMVPQTRLFVALEDPLPAGFEPVQASFATESQEVVSRYWEARYGERGPWWGGFDHREMYDDRALFFAQELFPGEHTQVYFVRALTSGTFLAPATKASEMYAPEVFGTTPQGFCTVQ